MHINQPYDSLRRSNSHLNIHDDNNNCHRGNLNVQSNIQIDIADDTRNDNNLNTSDSKSVSTIPSDLQKLDAKSVVLCDVTNTTNKRKNLNSHARLTPDDIGSTYDDQSSTDTADIVLINDAENRLTKKFENKIIFENNRDDDFEKKIDVRGDIIAAEITTVLLPLSQAPVISQPDEGRIDIISATASSTSSLPLSSHLENVPCNVVAGGCATRTSKRKYSSMNSVKSSGSSSLSVPQGDSASGCPIATVSLDKLDERDRHREEENEKEKDNEKEKNKLHERDTLTKATKEVVLEIKEGEKNVRKARMRSPSNLIEGADLKNDENGANGIKIKKNDAWKKKDLISLSEILKNEKIDKVGKKIEDDSKILKKMKK